ARLRHHLPRAARGARRVRGTAAGQSDAAPCRERALHDRVALARCARGRAHDLPARRDARRARRHDDADGAALGDDLPDQQHAGLAPTDHERRAGTLVHRDRAGDHAERRRPRHPVARDAGAGRHGPAAARRGDAQRIVAEYASELAATLRLSTLGGEGPVAGQGRLDVRARGWYNPNLDYRFYMVPGILVQLVTMVGTLLTALNIVREKELGTLEQ